MTAIQLWTKNRRIAFNVAKDYFIVGSEAQDVRQEALIALWIAARDYKPERGPFAPFADMVIRRRLASCVKMANRQKHTPLNQSLRTIVCPSGEERDIEEAAPHLHQVVNMAEGRANLALIIRAIDSELSEFERECVIGVAVGMDYLDMGPVKKVDNALFRARKKLRKALEAA